eukprot:m.1439512 g.1439512  ORF g.1439512 m.1439512 type:complete len:266 (+) comp25093_c0_seq39:845-1642(+)
MDSSNKPKPRQRSAIDYFTEFVVRGDDLAAEINVQQDSTEQYTAESHKQSEFNDAELMEQWKDVLQKARRDHHERILADRVAKSRLKFTNRQGDKLDQQNWVERELHALRGHANDIPAVMRHIRIFLSSTFTDTGPTRDFLMQHVWPFLRQFCQDREIHFEVVDLRWGVNDTMVDNHQIYDICMSEIDKCKRLSIGPFFLFFATNKFGWRMPPGSIAQAEFEAILAQVPRCIRCTTCRTSCPTRPAPTPRPCGPGGARGVLCSVD